MIDVPNDSLLFSVINPPWWLSSIIFLTSRRFSLLSPWDWCPALDHLTFINGSLSLTHSAVLREEQKKKRNNQRSRSRRIVSRRKFVDSRWICSSRFIWNCEEQRVVKSVVFNSAQQWLFDASYLLYSSWLKVIRSEKSQWLSSILVASGYYTCPNDYIPCRNATDCVPLMEICVKHRDCDDRTGHPLQCQFWSFPRMFRRRTVRMILF